MPSLSSRSLKIAVLGFAVILAGCDRQGSEQAQPQPEAGAPAAAPQAGVADRSHKGSEMPDLTFKDPAGKALRMVDLKGKPLLVNLWATWCTGCLAELPTLEKLAANGTIRVLTVSQDMNKLERVPEFLLRHGGTHLEPWLDPDAELTFHYGTGTLPTTVLYDAQGREVWRFVGERDWADAESAKLLAEGGS